VLIGQWLLTWSPGANVTAEDFRSVAWRTLGEGMLLIDMYEQWLEREEAGASAFGPREPQPEGAQWWHKCGADTTLRALNPARLFVLH
jgi:hypothetical protein